MIYQECKNERYTLEIYRTELEHIIKFFDGDKEVIYLNFTKPTAITDACVNELVKVINNGVYEYN